MPSEEDMEIFYEVFMPTIRNSKGYGGPRWWLHGYAGTSRGTASCWSVLQDAGLVIITAVCLTNVHYDFDVQLTELGHAAVAEHHPEYKKEYENNIIQRVESRLEG